MTNPTKLTEEQKLALQTIHNADFNYADHFEDLYKKTFYDVPEININIKRIIDQKIVQLKNKTTQKSPLIYPIIGSAGSGKTHLLGNLLNKASENNAFFIPVDLTPVKKLFETLNIAIIDALTKEYKNSKIQKFQLFTLIKNMMAEANYKNEKYKKKLDEENFTFSIDEVYELSEGILNGLFKKHRFQIQNYTSVIKALCYLLLDDKHYELFHYVKSWLSNPSQAMTENEVKELKLEPRNEIELFSALTWVMSLNDSFTILAMDQLDTLLTDYQSRHNSPIYTIEKEEHEKYTSMIMELNSDILKLYSKTIHTFSVMMMISESWELLNKIAIKSAMGRFDNPSFISPPDNVEVLQKLVISRMEEAYKITGYKPPFKTFPFTDDFFTSKVGMYPREFLSHCNDHIKKCISLGFPYTTNEVISIDTIIDEPDKNKTKFKHIDDAFKKYSSQFDEKSIVNIDDGIIFWHNAINVYANAFLYENKNISDSIRINKSELNKANNILVTYQSKNAKTERFLYVSPILQKYGTGFINKLNDAKKITGLTKTLKFKKLIILRPENPPKTGKSKEIYDDLIKEKGIYINPDKKIISKLFALIKIYEEFSYSFKDWVFYTKPTSEIGLYKDELEWLIEELKAMVSEPPSSPGDSETSPVTKPSITNHPKEEPPVTSPLPNETKSPDVDGLIKAPITDPYLDPYLDPAPDTDTTYSIDNLPIPAEEKKIMIRLGHLLKKSNEIGEPLDIDVKILRNHLSIIGGSGSGKTVLLKRIVEEAAVHGIPSVVIDCSGDLTLLGKKWSQRPDKFDTYDDEMAKKYFANTEVIVWTPSKPKGNDFCLPYISDLSSLSGDADDLSNAIESVIELLDKKLKLKTEQKPEKKAAMRLALNIIAKRKNQNTISQLCEILANIEEYDLPPNLPEIIFPAAHHIAEHIKLLTICNSELSNTNFSSIKDLVTSKSGKTRISIVNLSLIPDPTAQQIHVYTILTSLFSEIKVNHPKFMNGLLVIDEAKEFAPSVGSPPSLSVIKRFALMARKYGYGVILATQSANTINNQIMTNLKLKICGYQSSKTTINVAESLFSTSNMELPLLKMGEFYINIPSKNNQYFQKPYVKIKTSLCLSYHPSNSPEEDIIIDLARKSRKIIFPDEFQN